MQNPIPMVRDLVFVGGGHTHALVLRKWAMNPMPGVRVTVIDPVFAAAYSGMLPGFVAGHYALEDLQIDLVRLSRFAGARFIRGAAVGLDPVAKTILVPGRPPIAYDLASIDVGITARMDGLPGFTDHATPAKPLAQFADVWDAFVAKVAEGKTPPHVAVIGGGIAGIELALTMQHRLGQLGAAAAVTVIDRSEILSGVPQGARRKLLAAMHAAGITQVDHSEITEVTPNGPVLRDGRVIDTALTIGAAGATPAPWLTDTGLSVTDGFLNVAPDLRCTGQDNLFAVGDCSHFTADPRPKAGVFAVRAAPILDHNLRALLQGQPTKPFKPQRDYLKLVSLGPQHALAQKNGWSVQGSRMWQLKDRIDRSFMAKLQDLPLMPPPPIPQSAPAVFRQSMADTKPLCGGCGAKVGQGALTAGLETLDPAARGPHVLSRPGDDAAITKSGDQWQVLSTDHLRALVEDPFVMAQLALHHAMGDVFAMGAQPQLALSQVILPRMNPELQARTLREISAATQAVLTPMGASLAGGHTTMGAEMTIGFTVTGLCDTPPITLAGAQRGDAIVLTRAIGSGTLFAADMQRRAKAHWTTEMLDELLQSQAALATALAPHATAMTDVTGFGLAGHALGIAQASNSRMKVSLQDVPFLTGALECAEAGIQSAIWPDNQAAAAPWVVGEPGTTQSSLLYDPQTCGGLLACIPNGSLNTIRQALGADANRLYVIGEVTDGEVGLEVA